MRDKCPNLANFSHISPNLDYISSIAAKKRSDGCQVIEPNALRSCSWHGWVNTAPPQMGSSQRTTKDHRRALTEPASAMQVRAEGDWGGHAKYQPWDMYGDEAKTAKKRNGHAGWNPGTALARGPPSKRLGQHGVAAIPRLEQTRCFLGGL